MSDEEAQTPRPDSPLNSTATDLDGVGGEYIESTRDEFLKMVASQGGDLARDVVKAFWEAGLGLNLQSATSISEAKEREVV